MLLQDIFLPVVYAQLSDLQRQNRFPIKFILSQEEPQMSVTTALIQGNHYRDTDQSIDVKQQSGQSQDEDPGPGEVQLQEATYA